MKMTKNLKRIMALLIAVICTFSMTSSAFAATTVTTTEDISVFSLVSPGNTVTYKAITIDGYIINNEVHPSTTTYLYCIKTSGSYAYITYTNPQGYDVYLDGTILNTSSVYLLKNNRYTIELYDCDDLIRSFEVTVIDSSIVYITIEINCYNAKNWLNYNENSVFFSAVNTAYNTLSNHLGGFNSLGTMPTVIQLGLPAGATAMDALSLLTDNFDIDIAVLGNSEYVTGLDGLCYQMCGTWSGWCYVTPTNTSPYYDLPMISAAYYTLIDGEHIVWVYTCDMTDIGTALTATS